MELKKSQYIDCNRFTLAKIKLEELFVQSPLKFTMFTFRDLSVDLLQMIPDNHILLAKLCAFYPGSAAEINQLHERVSG